jgi:hypothetical protein
MAALVGDQGNAARLESAGHGPTIPSLFRADSANEEPF